MKYNDAMKIKGLILLILLPALETYSQSQDQNIAIFCKIWGFLKYYHPTVATGKIDWDNEFINRVIPVSEMNDKTAISNYYLRWIDELGKIDLCKKCTDTLPGSIRFNYNVDWLKDSSVFTNTLMHRLEYIRLNRNQGKNHYTPVVNVFGFKAASPNYKTEKPYPDAVYPSPPVRLLTLSRYWNIINYFYPYKYCIGKDWDSILSEKISQFKNAADTLSYHLAIRDLISSINDTHAGVFFTPYLLQELGTKMPPFIFEIIDHKAVITGSYNDSLTGRDDIQYGDIITKLNGEPLETIINERGKYISASNEDCRIRDVKGILLLGKEDSVSVTIDRNGLVMERIIHRYDFRRWNLFHTPKDDDAKRPAWEIRADNIGYVNLGNLDPGKVKKMMQDLLPAKAIIFDIRNYPKSVYPAIAKYLNTERKPFVRASMPNINFPGIYTFSKLMYAGTKNKLAYKGRVILLMDERTQSMAEFTVMALQTAPNVTTMGNHTAGADGDLIKIPLPGGYTTAMSSLGIYYPDGKPTQRTGIIPDIIVRPGIEGIRQKKDEVLDKAIEVINNGIAN